MITKLFGLTLLFGSFVVVYLFEETSHATGFLRILHWPAIALTGFGPLGLILVCYDFQVVWRTLGAILGTSPSTHQRKHYREARLLNRWGREYYEEGPEFFDRLQGKGLSPFVRKMVERMAIRMPTKDIYEMLEVERDHRRVQLLQCLNVVNLAVRLAPSMGMLGTILGMVRLLSTLEDPSHIGPHMSLALLTTFFGLFFSLIVWTPMQQKIERLLDVDLERFNQLISWLETLEKRKPISYFAEPIGIETPQPTDASSKRAA